MIVGIRWAVAECPQFSCSRVGRVPETLAALPRRSPQRQEPAGLQCYLGSGATVAPSPGSPQFYCSHVTCSTCFHVPRRQLQLNGLQANAVPYRALMVWQNCKHGRAGSFVGVEPLQNCPHKRPEPERRQFNRARLQLASEASAWSQAQGLAWQLLPGRDLRLPNASRRREHRNRDRR